MRQSIIDRFKAELQKHDEVLAFYEGGSASFGRNDEYSDLDFGIVVKDEFEAQAQTLVEEIMQSISPIGQKFIMPQPTWHGMWQGFYHLQDTSPYLLLDICIIKASKESYFTEVEMHGVPVIYFDRTGKVGKEHVDMTEIEAMIPKRIERARFISTMLGNFVDKEIARQRLIDAIDTYINIMLRTLVELLRIKYDRVRFSFGCRYLSYDLPTEVYNEIKDYFYVKDMEDLQAKNKKVMAQIQTLLKEHK